MKLERPDLLRTQSYINGEWVNADNNATVDVLNPATGETVASIANLAGDETRRAIEAAEAALPAWKAKSAKESVYFIRRNY